jgi:hypothetical protein
MIHPVPTIAARNVRPRRRPVAAPAPAAALGPVVITEPGREAVSASRLLAFINDQVSARAECAGVEVRAEAWYPAPCDGGCNWAESSLLVHVAGAVRPGAFRELRKVIAIARAQYDVLALEPYRR